MQNSVITAEFFVPWYKKVAYIESDWQQYINSWYIPNYNTKIYVKFAHNEHVIDTPIFWTRWYNSANQFTLWSHPSEYWASSWSSQRIFNWNSKSWSDYSQWTVIEFEYDRSNWKYWSQTGTWTNSTWSPWYNMIIFWLTTQNNVDSRRFSWKMRRFTIRESWTLKKDFVPCYRKSDNVVWMIDIVNNVFYTNLWGWSFTYWL